MSIRAIGVAVAVVFAMACRTSGSQTREASGTAQAPSGDTHGASGTSTAQAPSSTTSSSDVSGSTASSAPGTSAGQDPLVEPGPPIKGHASDQVVSGKIEEVSDSSVTISSHAGDRKVLQIEAETDIRIDGMDASAADLEEGQPVRASYNQAEGEDVAVEIEAGRESPGGEAKELGMPPGSATGGSAPGSSGSASEPAAPTGTGSGR